jgi:hypothetical protein
MSVELNHTIVPTKDLDELLAAGGDVLRVVIFDRAY